MLGYLYDNMARLAGANITDQTIKKQVGNRKWRFSFWKTTWWENGFVFQKKYGYYNKRNLKMKATLYFPSSNIGKQQKSAFSKGKDQLDDCIVTQKRNLFTVNWYK